MFRPFSALTIRPLDPTAAVPVPPEDLALQVTEVSVVTPLQVALMVTVASALPVLTLVTRPVASTVARVTSSQVRV